MIEVVKPGLAAAIQDAGRPGWRAMGVPSGGSMDQPAMRIANALVGNAPDAPVLEIALAGPELVLREDALLAVYGGDLAAACGGEPVPYGRPVYLAAGSKLSFGHARHGCRAYLAVAGGFDGHLVMGSRSTEVRAGFGGMAGRTLRSGDTLGWGRPSAAAAKLIRRLSREAAGRGRRAVPWHVLAFSPFERCPEPGDAAVVRIMRGLEGGWFAPQELDALTTSTFRISPDSDRMGIRLAGPALLRRCPRQMLSEGVAPGTIQVPPDGTPIVLMADSQTVGGYPRIAHAAAVDLPLLAQAKPGDCVRFEWIPLEAAQAEWVAQERALAALCRIIRHKLEAYGGQE